MKRQGKLNQSFEATNVPELPLSLKPLAEKLESYIGKKNTALEDVHSPKHYIIKPETGKKPQDEKLCIFFGEAKQVEIKSPRKGKFTVKIAEFEKSRRCSINSVLPCDDIEEAFYTASFHLAEEMPNYIAHRLQEHLPN